MPKVENPLLVSFYANIVDKVLSETSNIDEANQKLRDLGHEIGQQIYLNTEIVDKTKDSVTISDKECIWCQEVHLEGMLGFGYCEIFSGILEKILEFKGVDAKVFQEMSRATGAEMCVWNVRLG